MLVVHVIEFIDFLLLLLLGTWVLCYLFLLHKHLLSSTYLSFYLNIIIKVHTKNIKVIARTENKATTVSSYFNCYFHNQKWCRCIYI